MDAAATQVFTQVATGCARAGLDLAQPFQLAWYNAVVEPALRLPDLGRPHALGILIANTRALWPMFLRALEREPARLDDPDPLDHYVMDAVSQVLAAIGPRHEVRYAHEAPPRLVAMQRLAEVSGLAHTSPSHLSVHPAYGPWIGLRAALVIDLDGPSGPAPIPSNPCPEWAEPSAALLARAQASDDWRSWLALRDSCPVGREHRYSDDQILYHYTKDPSVLTGR